MPAEWEPHAATWIAWPHNTSDWPGKFGPIPWVFAEMVRRITPGERVRLLVNPQTERQARRALALVGVELEQIDFLRIPTDRGWTRDTGPIFVRREGPPPETAIVRFHFNAWAKYPDWRKDNKIPERAAKRFGFPLHPVRAGKRDFVLEGGSIEVNGRGTLITTEECLLDPVVQTRNPGLSREEIEAVLKDTLGVTNVLWLGKGIAGDDTHGHVDDLCRFVDHRIVVLCQESNARDVNYKPLKENRERLTGLRLQDGSALDIVDLPMPGPVAYRSQRLPASYANFYVANAAVLVPTFNDPNDRIALGILTELFHDRPVIGIHAVDLVWGLGTIHCLTQQEPAG